MALHDCSVWGRPSLHYSVCFGSWFTFRYAESYFAYKRECFPVTSNFGVAQYDSVTRQHHVSQLKSAARALREREDAPAATHDAPGSPALVQKSNDVALPAAMSLAVRCMPDRIPKPTSKDARELQLRYVAWWAVLGENNLDVGDLGEADPMDENEDEGAAAASADVAESLDPAPAASLEPGSPLRELGSAPSAFAPPAEGIDPQQGEPSILGALAGVERQEANLRSLMEDPDKEEDPTKLEWLFEKVRTSTEQGSDAVDPWDPMDVFDAAMNFEKYHSLVALAPLMHRFIQFAQGPRCFRKFKQSKTAWSERNQLDHDLKLIREGLQLDPQCRGARMQGWHASSLVRAREVVDATDFGAEGAAIPPIAFNPSRQARIVSNEEHMPDHPQVLLIDGDVFFVLGGQRVKPAQANARGIARLFYTTTSAEHVQALCLLRTTAEKFPWVTFSWTSRPRFIRLTKKAMANMLELRVLEHREDAGNTAMEMELHPVAVTKICEARIDVLNAKTDKQMKAKLKEMADPGHLKGHAKITYDIYSFMDRGWTPAGSAPTPSCKWKWTHPALSSFIHISCIEHGSQLQRAWLSDV